MCWKSKTGFESVSNSLLSLFNYEHVEYKFENFVIVPLVFSNNYLLKPKYASYVKTEIRHRFAILQTTILAVSTSNLTSFQPLNSLFIYTMYFDKNATKGPFPE